LSENEVGAANQSNDSKQAYDTAVATPTALKLQLQLIHPRRNLRKRYGRPSLLLLLNWRTMATYEEPYKP
jgi:hypothetical protein